MATAIPCYDMRYTFVEKLQTIATKFRVMQQTNVMQVNLMRQYYDIYNLLQQQQVKDFIGSDEYFLHKERRFPAADLEVPLQQNQAFLLEDQQTAEHLNTLYKNSNVLYYNGQPDFKTMLDYVKLFLHEL